MRHWTRKVAAICGAASLLVLAGCFGGTSGNSMTLMLDVGYLPKHALFFSAEKRGFFDAEGLDVTIMPGSGSSGTVTSVDTGRVDVGWADFGVTVTSQGRGVGVKQINLMQARSAYAVVGLAGKGINSWKDLPGKTVATEGGGAPDAMWPLVLARLGMKKDAVNVVHASSASKIPGLLAGQWDANLALSISDEPAIDALDRKAVVLKWSDLGIDIYGNGIVASDKKLKQNPERFRKFNRAMQKGFQWACENPEKAAGDFQKSVEGYKSKTIALAINEQCALNWGERESATRFGVMDDAGVQKIIDVARQYLGLNPDRKLVPSDVYTNDYLEPLQRGVPIHEP